MTAKEKFEARMNELGMSFEDLESNGYAGIETKDKIIVMVHYDHDDGYYTEYHYPPFNSMSRDQIDVLTAHFASEYCSPDHKEEADFFSKLANWCAGNGPSPLFACDCYPNIDPYKEINFEDDPEEKTAKEEYDEETAYQQDLARNEVEIAHIRQNLNFYKERLEDMIRMEFRRGHNLYGTFNPYLTWGSHQLCGYEIGNKTIVVEEMSTGNMVLALYEEGYEAIRLWLRASDFPIEVLFNIYASMK